jgi:UDP-N-acetylmuramoyl-tripeptide--D-alanyl-D-alanine ligase
MVAREVLSLIVSLPRDGVAVLNADDPLVAEMAGHTKARVVTYGQDLQADVRLSRLSRLSPKGFGCEIIVAGQSFEWHQRHLVSRHQLSLLLSAVAVAHVLKLDMHAAIKRLQEYTPPKGQLSIEKGIHGITVIDDSFDASPESMMAALENLRAVPARRRIAVIGDITDLGSEDFAVHKKIGKLAGETAHIVIVVGERMREAGAEAVFVGADVHHFDKSQDVGKWLVDFLRQEDVVLVCGSRQMKMDAVISRLVA